MYIFLKTYSHSENYKRPSSLCWSLSKLQCTYIPSVVKTGVVVLVVVAVVALPGVASEVELKVVDDEADASTMDYKFTTLKLNSYVNFQIFNLNV